MRTSFRKRGSVSKEPAVPLPSSSYGAIPPMISSGHVEENTGSMFSHAVCGPHRDHWCFVKWLGCARVQPRTWQRRRESRCGNHVWRAVGQRQGGETPYGHRGRSPKRFRCVAGCPRFIAVPSEQRSRTMSAVKNPDREPDLVVLIHCTGRVISIRYVERVSGETRHLSRFDRKIIFVHDCLVHGHICK